MSDKELLDVRVATQRVSKKLMTLYRGPYFIVRVYNKGTVDIADNNLKIQRVHTNRLRALTSQMLWKDMPSVPYDEAKEFMARLKTLVATQTNTYVVSNPILIDNKTLPAQPIEYSDISSIDKNFPVPKSPDEEENSENKSNETLKSHCLEEDPLVVPALGKSKVIKLLNHTRPPPLTSFKNKPKKIKNSSP